MDHDAVLQVRPDDGPSALWRELCKEGLSGVDAAWQPVLETGGK